MLVNIAFFAAVSKEEIMSSDRLIAAVFFTKMFGETAGRAVSVIIALSAIGNVLAVLFGQGRINQELGREGALPFSRFFASNKPFNAPFAGLALQWAVSLIIMLAPPGGDIYSFLLNLISYPLNIFNALVALGLIIVNVRKEQYGWSSPIKATLPVSIFYFLANLFLIAAPLVPPSSPANAPYESLPFYLHCVVGFGIIGLGLLWYIVRCEVLPRLGGYRLSRREEVGSDGLTRKVFYKVKRE